MKTAVTSFMAGLLICFATTALAQDGISLLYLEDGSIIRGEILELRPNDTVKIQTRDGSIFVYDFAEVKKIERADDSTESTRPASEQVAERKPPARENPYTVHRNASLGLLGGFWGATVIGAAAMGDDYIGTTIIPVFGPFVTVARINNDPFGGFLPGGRPLLIASGALQTASAVYLTAAAILESQHEHQRLALMPTLRTPGVQLSLRF